MGSLGTYYQWDVIMILLYRVYLFRKRNFPKNMLVFANLCRHCVGT